MRLRLQLLIVGLLLSGWVMEIEAQATMDPAMPGMQHGEMAGKPHPTEPEQTKVQGPNHENGLLQEPENTAHRSGSANSEVFELLKSVDARKPLALGEFEAMAAIHNPTLRQAQAQVERAEGLAKQAGLWPNPVVGYQGEQIRGGSFGGGEQGGFVQQTIPLGNKRGLEREIYRQQKGATEMALEEQRQKVLSDVRHDYYDTLAAQAEVGVRRELLRVAMDASVTVHQLANIGQADAPDILQTEVEAEQAKMDYMTTQRVYLKRYARMSAMVGMPEMEVAPLAGDLYGDPGIDAATLVMSMAGKSPAVRRADREIDVARAAVASAKRQVVPDLTLRAGEQYNGSLISPNAQQRTGAQSFASASIGLPLWNRNQGNVATAVADATRAEAEARRTRLALDRAAAPALEDFQVAQLQAERYRTELLPRAKRAYELYRTKYEAMAAAYPQVLVSQRTYFQLRIGYIEALRAMWMNAISLNNSMLSGGLDSVGAESTDRLSGRSSLQSGGLE